MGSALCLYIGGQSIVGAFFHGIMMCLMYCRDLMVLLVTMDHLEMLDLL